MASIPGTILAAKISPGDTTATFPTHEDIYGKGGLVSVTNFNELTSIPLDRQKIGMVVHVNSNSQYYSLSSLSYPLTSYSEFFNKSLFVAEIIPTVTNYLSTNNVTLSALTITNTLTSINSLTINGNISGNNLRTSFNQGSATGNWSFAANRGRAFGDFSFAEGVRTEASGLGSHAEGFNTIASGAYSHAEGSGGTFGRVYATGTGSHAEGFRTEASGDYSHAEGDSTEASGADSHAEGQNTIASGLNSHAEGSSTIASGSASHAEGQTTRASGDFGSHAEGFFTESYGQIASHAEGSYTVASGSASHAEGSNTIASGNNSHAEGNETTASGNNSHAEGNRTSTGRRNSFLYLSATKMFTFTNNVSANFSYVLSGTEIRGFNNVTDNFFNITVASRNSITGAISATEDVLLRDFLIETAGQYLIDNSGEDSHAEGINTTASGIGSHAEGFNTTASGDYGHAEGATTVASGNASHAQGLFSRAEGLGSFASGWSNTVSVSADYGIALGNNAFCNHSRSYIWNGGNFIGPPGVTFSTSRPQQYVVNAPGGTALYGKVGIGTDSIENALTVNGNLSSSGTIFDVVASKPSTVSASASAVINMVYLSQATYNGLAVKNPQTLYIII